jgi:hypothetical protein
MLFQYSHLAKGAIRVVTFHPRSTPDDLHVLLEHIDLFPSTSTSTSTPTPYTVLASRPTAATAATTTAKQPVTLNGRSRLIDARARSLLRASFAASQGAGRFWIEALSVNARDPGEVAELGLRRTEIYARAERVCVDVTGLKEAAGEDGGGGGGERGVWAKWVGELARADDAAALRKARGIWMLDGEGGVFELEMSSGWGSRDVVGAVRRIAGRFSL